MHIEKFYAYISFGLSHHEPNLDQILDATKVQIGAPLPRTDVLWIAEQVPGELLQCLNESVT